MSLRVRGSRSERIQGPGGSHPRIFEGAEFGASDILQGLSYTSIPGTSGTDSAIWLELTTERRRSEPGRTGVKTFLFQVQNQGSPDQDALGHCGVRLPLR